MKCELAAASECLLITAHALLALIVDVQHALVHEPLVVVEKSATLVLDAAILELASDFLKNASI